MSKKRRQRKLKAVNRRRTTKIPFRQLTYAKALETAGQIRPSTMVLPDVSIEHPPPPDLPVAPMTQAKLITLTHLMMLIGRTPVDFPVDEFDRAITYRKLEKQSLEWLEKCGIHAQRDFAPLAAENYIWLFANKDRLPVPEDNIERFFSRLIHCLLIEVQILIAKQYYHGLGLYKKGSNLSRLDEVLSLQELASALPSKTEYKAKFDTFNTIALDELHGRVFLEYCAIMIRAQWDKLTRLSSLVFGLRSNWDSISEGLKALEQKIADESLNPWCRKHLQVFIKIAQDRLSESGWIKRFRDPILHDVGQHSAGVVPHRTSVETTSDMWDKVCDEHDWLREAMMAALVAFASVKTPDPSKPKRPLVSGVAIVQSPVEKRN